MRQSSQSAPTPQDLAAQWASARRLHPIYSELAREFVVDVAPCADLEAGVETPGPESVEQAQQWLQDMDERIGVHQLRQFLQTSSVVEPEGLIDLVQYLLAKNPKTDSVRDKIDFLLVQYFSQIAPTDLDDDKADLACVAQGLKPILGPVDLKTPVWLNPLHRVLDAARRCRSLDELLHGGILEQGRKAKMQAGELFYAPIALVAFTRFGYLMRRVFFRLMHEDLNYVLEGLNELEEKGVETIDCRRAQFSEQEPIVRLRMICQSWKVMFQAEYSSGQPLRMLVDLRASLEEALGRPAGRGTASKQPARHSSDIPPGKSTPAAAMRAAAGVGGHVARQKPATSAPHPETSANPAPEASEKAEVPDGAAEFEISIEPQDWSPDS